MSRTKTPKVRKEPDRIWPVVMDSWFHYFADKYGTKPTFIGAAASSYKKIVKIIKQKTIEAGFEWNEQTAHQNMIAFFEKAYHHSDLRFQNHIRNNFTLPNLLFHFDKITAINERQGPTNSFQKFARAVQIAQSGIPAGRP